jgi:hypothetical protein
LTINKKKGTKKKSSGKNLLGSPTQNAAHHTNRIYLDRK